MLRRNSAIYDSNRYKNENYFGVQKLYEELKSKESYSFITTLDNNNKMYYAKQQNKAYIETIYDGSESKFIIKMVILI